MQQSYLISRQPDYPGQYLTIPDQNQSSIYPTMQYQTIPLRLSQSRYIPPITNPNINNYQYAPYPQPISQQSSIFQNNSVSLRQNPNLNPNQNMNNWNIENGNNQTNVANFPFGKDRAQMYHYVSGQMNSSIDQENKKVIEKFRIDAIRHRNQRVIKHLGKVPYVTESMMPGTSIDASKFVQKIAPAQIPQPRYVSVPIRYTPSIIPAPTPSRKPSPSPSPQKYPIIKTPRKLATNSSSIAVQANFQQQFPLRSPHKKSKHKKRRYYTIQQQQQQIAMHKIEDMLHDINRKLQRNEQLLEFASTIDENKRSRISTEPIVNQRVRNRKYFDDGGAEGENQESRGDKLPIIRYSVGQKQKQRLSGVKVKNSQIKFSSSLKDHLKLLKKNRKRMQDLDQYIYQ